MSWDQIEVKWAEMVSRVNPRAIERDPVMGVAPAAKTKAPPPAPKVEQGKGAIT
jgi:hypothetical protein